METSVRTISGVEYVETKKLPKENTTKEKVTLL